jgi:hypothetical protein
MTGPWGKIKQIWYRRQAKRALWFMRYMDRVMHEVGLTRGEIRKAWRDFTDHPMARRVILDRMAVINKITIKRQNRTRLQRALIDASNQLAKTSADLTKRLEDAQAQLARAQAENGTGSDKPAPEEGVSH